MLLQAYDFLHLQRSARLHACRWPAPTSTATSSSGIDLIRRTLGARRGREAFGVTAPLVTRADGKKIGKTEKARGLAHRRPHQPVRVLPVLDQRRRRRRRARSCAGSRSWRARRSRRSRRAAARRPQERAAQRALAREHDRARCTATPSSTPRRAGERGAVRRATCARSTRRCSTRSSPTCRTPSTTRAQLDGEGVALVELLPRTTLASSQERGARVPAERRGRVNGERAARPIG